MKARNGRPALAVRRWILVPCLMFVPSLAATPRQSGDQVGLFALEVSKPNPTHIKFDFKVRNMTGLLSPNILAPFLTTSASARIFRPSVTIPSPRPELEDDSVVPESLGGLFSTPQTVNGGDLDFTIMSHTSVDPDHVSDLIAQLNQSLDARNLLLNQFSAEGQAAMWSIASGLSPIPLDWEGVLSKLLDIWIPGSDMTMTLIDVGVTSVAMQNTLQSLQVLQPTINQLADVTESQAMDVWLPYGTAKLTGSIPDISDPGIASFLPVGAKGEVPSGNTAAILVTPENTPTAAILTGTTLLALGAQAARRRRTGLAALSPH